ncbi:hypothetical protein ANO14919_135190 [Xylariales sp. No.14919]|nr:hypothetical protein ANO14919_135190 [Xylariales sp. No.14919]
MALVYPSSAQAAPSATRVSSAPVAAVYYYYYYYYTVLD